MDDVMYSPPARKEACEKCGYERTIPEGTYGIISLHIIDYNINMDAVCPRCLEASVRENFCTMKGVSQ
jgi:hypothetical protein